MDRSRVEAAFAALGAQLCIPVVTSTVNAVTVRELAALYSSSREATELAAWDTERGRVAHVVRVLGDRPAGVLRMRDVDDLRRALAERSPATRNRVVVRLTAMLRWGAEREHLAAYPLPRVRLEAENNERSTYRSEDDTRAIVAALRARGRHEIAAMVVVAFDGGLRRGEVTRLRLSQLDHRDGVITLYARETKGRADRSTVLSDWAAETVLNLARPAGCPWVFVSRRGRPYNPRTVLRYYQQACDEAGVRAAPGERCWFHDNRSGFGDKQVTIGTPPTDVMAMAGWKDFRTMRRYLRRPAKKIAAEAKQRLDASRARVSATQSVPVRIGPKKSAIPILTTRPSFGTG
jgi:integrase